MKPPVRMSSGETPALATTVMMSFIAWAALARASAAAPSWAYTPREMTAMSGRPVAVPVPLTRILEGPSQAMPGSLPCGAGFETCEWVVGGSSLTLPLSWAWARVAQEASAAMAMTIIMAVAVNIALRLPANCVTSSGCFVSAGLGLGN